MKILLYISLYLTTQSVTIIKHTSLHSSPLALALRNLSQISPDQETTFRTYISTQINTSLQQYFGDTLTNTSDPLSLLNADKTGFTEEKLEYSLNEKKLFHIEVNDMGKKMDSPREVLFIFYSRLNMVVQQDVVFQYMVVGQEEDGDDVAEIVRKYVWRFCERIVQVDFKVKELREDVLRMFKADFGVEKGFGATAGMPVVLEDGNVDLPETKYKENFDTKVLEDNVTDDNKIRFVIETPEENGGDFSKRINNVMNNPNEDNSLFFLIHPTDSRFDHIELYIVYIPSENYDDEDIIKNKDKIHIIIESAYFQYDYEFNILTKRFIIKTIERLFFRIKDQVYPSLINVTKESNSPNLTLRMTDFLKNYQHYFSPIKTLTEEEKTVTLTNNEIYNSECEFEFTFSHNASNFEITYKGTPINTEQKKQTITIHKTFPISSMYYTGLFPRGFLQNFMQIFDHILPNVDSEGNLVPNSGTYRDMVNPFVDGIERIEEYGGVSVRVSQVFEKVQMNDFRLNVFEFGQSGVRRVDYVAYEKSRLLV